MARPGDLATPEQLHIDGADRAQRERAARAVAEAVAARSAELTAAAVEALRDAGCSVREIGVLVGVSHQHAHQLFGQAAVPSRGAQH